MTRYFIASCLLITAVLTNTAIAEPLGKLETIKTKTFAGDKITFPQDLAGGTKYVLFLAMGADRDNGEEQMNELLDWQASITEQGGLPEGIIGYHFPVMESPPFFVKGIIRGAMSDSYEPTVSPEKSGVLFVDDLTQFAVTAGLTLDQEPTIALVDGEGNVLSQIKGNISPENIAALQALLK